MAKKTMTKEERQQHIRALEGALERHMKSVTNNIRLMQDALRDDDYLDAEMRRRHANESFEQIQAFLAELEKAKEGV